MPADHPTDLHPESTGAVAGRCVLIDALAARFGGTAYATVQLARHLALQPKVSAVIVVTRRGSIVERGLAGVAHVRCETLPAAARVELLRRCAWESSRLPAVVAREECDVVITTSGMLPHSPGCPVICLLFNPVMYERRTPANLLRRWAVRRTARDACYVVTPSQSMADLASASIRRRCAVVPLGVDHGVFSPVHTEGQEILCVADFYTHKRHDLVLDAWLLLPLPRPRLRLIGDPAVDRNAYTRLQARIQALPDANSIAVEHGVSLDRLVQAYHRARVFLMPSERESFCMPLAESMACGIPAVVRGLPSLRETGGAGARYVDGDHATDWATALRDLIEDDDEHQRMRTLAVRAANRFSWTAFAANVAGHL